MLPDGFIENSLTALPMDERAALTQALEKGVHARGLRLRPGVKLEIVQDAMPGDYPPVPWAENAYYLAEESETGRHVLHAAGAYYLQEPSAMAAVSALDVEPGQRVLDLCAAPGGKATQIAARLAGKGVLVANEIVPSRARVLSQNIERMGVRNAIVTNEAPDKLAGRWQGYFDRVLVDAPCSGEGMFRRTPESLTEWKPGTPAGCAARQWQVLENAAEMLCEGGILVYSTCTFNETENEEVVTDFLNRHAEYEPEAFSLPGVGDAPNGTIRLWPHRLRGEGHFVARLRKRQGMKRDSHAQDMDTVSLPDAFRETGIAEGILNAAIQKLGEWYWMLPMETPPLSGIRVLRFGLSLGEQRGKVFLPDHALAKALPLCAFARVYPVDDILAARYLRGETLPGDGLPAGWTLITYRGLGLGFVKCAQDVLKNHLPKGLRHG